MIEKDFITYGITGSCIATALILSECFDKINIPNKVVDGYMFG